ncbi:hypothetical protein BDQ12DRAFT_728943 [Crucibulum laeve]|uniref:Uncharacterized protein n=1 Tax=Crucibulum laeve TaxID=68775 RepID=A0A5C3LIT8_9AGAR|nr:hypothetical protein BDQ12DRAFT_728943 [Crucibulum laeve]
MFEDPQFRRHIRSLLYEYALTHLTTDYIQFTEDAVSELLSQSLAYIPTTDPTALVIPSEPFDVFSQNYRIAEIAAYEEKIQTSPEALAYLKDVLRSRPGKSRSEKAQNEDNDGHPTVITRPTSPVLTLKAQLMTPQLGLLMNSQTRPQPQTVRDLLLTARCYIKLHELPVEPAPEPEVSADQVLHLRFTLTAALAPSVKELIKMTFDMNKPRESYVPPLVRLRDQHELSQRKEDLAKERRVSEEEFIPIFPRARKPGNGCTVAGEVSVLKNMKSVRDLSHVVPQMESSADKEEETSNANMRIVDGWETIPASSPSPLPSLTSSQEEDQLDELFQYSSPNTEPLDVEIEESKIDVKMPRSRRIGGGAGRGEHILNGKSLKSFLVPLLPPSKLAGSFDANINVNEKQTKQGILPSLSPPELSIIGQAPSIQLSHRTKLNSSENDDMDADLDAELVNMYDASQNLHEPIMNEKLSLETTSGGDDGSIMMEVPNLPPPTEHPQNALVLPTQLANMLADTALVKGTRPKAAEHIPSACQFLRKAKGIRSLGLALSWITFKTDSKLPSHLEITGVASLLDVPESVKARSMHQTMVDRIQRAIAAAIGTGEELLDEKVTEKESRKWVMLDDDEGDRMVSQELFKLEIILTRRERQRLAGLCENAWEKQEPAPLISTETEANAQKLLHIDGQGDFQERPTKRARLDSSPLPSFHVLDDSGIGMPHYQQDYPVDCQFDDDVPSITYLSVELDPSTHMDEDKENIPPPFTSLPPPPDFVDLDYGAEDGYDLLIEEEDDIDMEDQLRDDDTLVLDGFNVDGYAAHVDNGERIYESRGSGYGEDGGYDQVIRDEDDIDMVDQLRDGDTVAPSGFNVDSYTTNVNEGVYDSRGCPFVWPFVWEPEGGYLYGTPPRNDISKQHETYPRAYQSPVHNINEDNWHQRRNTTSPGGRSRSLTGHIPELRRSQQENDADGWAQRPAEEQAQAAPPLLLVKPKIAQNYLGIAAFAQLCARTISTPVEGIEAHPAVMPTISSPATLPSESKICSAPNEIVNRNTLVLPPMPSPPASTHKYFTSFALLQKQALVRALSRDFAIELVERDALDGADLILDPCTSVIFVPLLSLPSECDRLLERVSYLSWTYDHLAVIFEAYPESLSLRPTRAHQAEPDVQINPYTPPTLKAIKKFRRDVDIAEAYGTKRPQCTVKVAFADEVRKAANYARLFGNMAEERWRSNDPGIADIIWGSREWIEEEGSEDEDNLASVDGLNNFSAMIILCEHTIQEFLDMSSESRLDTFGPFIGIEMMNVCNADLERRFLAIDSGDTAAESALC